jgi:hypothetical protein
MRGTPGWRHAYRIDRAGQAGGELLGASSNSAAGVARNVRALGSTAMLEDTSKWIDAPGR